MRPIEAPSLWPTALGSDALAAASSSGRTSSASSWKKPACAAAAAAPSGHARSARTRSPAVPWRRAAGPGTRATVPPSPGPRAEAPAAGQMLGRRAGRATSSRGRRARLAPRPGRSPARGLSCARRSSRRPARTGGPGRRGTRGPTATRARRGGAGARRDVRR